jgi:xanthine dehydrogenase accessory factor
VTVDIGEVARELSARGQPYAIATVVWRRAPSSGQLGARALISADGRVRGWVAGACAEPAVVGEALKALGEGLPRLVFLGTPEELAEHKRDGVVSVPIACQSEGALEVYVEPVLSRPQLVAIGRSPAVDALAGMAVALGWRAVVIDDGGTVAEHPGLPVVLTSMDLAAAGVGDRSLVVVATQGHYDEDALEAALATPAPYVGLVASRRRADAVLAFLRERGVPEDQLARIHAPAGLDLGRVASDEIAVAILAELVQLKASGALAGDRAPAPTSTVHEAIDPVCGMTVMVSSSRYRTTHAGRTVYFCSAGCLKKFEADPAAF